MIKAFKVGDRIRFDTHSNLGIREDVIRDTFTQHFTLEPYARNYSAPALTLTAHSWCLESDVVEVVDAGPDEGDYSDDGQGPREDYSTDSGECDLTEGDDWQSDDDRPDELLAKLDAYGHLTWTLGDEDWMACFDAIREGDKIAYHVVVNCESGGFIDTVEKGIALVSEAGFLINLPSTYVDAGIESHLSAREGHEPVGRFAYRDCEKRWARHIKQLIKG